MDPKELIGEKLSDRLRLSEHLGRGPIGDVFSAELQALKRAVGKSAVKLASPRGRKDPDELVSQARTLKLEHSHLVEVQSVGVVRSGPLAGKLYVTSELADRRLDQILERGETLDEKEVENLAKGALEGLAHLHSQGIVHGQVRPTNLLCFGDTWKLSGTELKPIRGDLEEIHVDERFFIFRAPETFEKDVLEPSSDLWSLGIVLHQALTGSLPFEKGDSGSKGDLIWRILNQLPQLGPLPARLEPLLKACLRREHHDRWPADKCLAYLRGEKIEVEVAPPEESLPKGGGAPVLPSALPTPAPLPPPPPSQPAPPRPIYRQPVFLFSLFLFLIVGFVFGWRGVKPPPVPIPNVPPDQLYSLNYQIVSLDPKGRFPQQRPGQAVGFAENLGEGVAIEMVQVPGGSFWMGSPEDEPRRDPSESPQHRVTVRSFYISRYEITQKQWRVLASQSAVAIPLSQTPSQFRGDGLPVESVSWREAKEFCARLSRLSGRSYRLPTEAEWEYSCRGNQTTPFTFGLTLNSDVANYQAEHVYGSGMQGIYRLSTVDVGSLGAANAWGLYDVHGNVWEWCEDFFGPYPSKPQFDPRGPTNGTLRVMRGGGWQSIPAKCRSAARVAALGDLRRSDLGFRVVLPELVYRDSL